MIKIDKGDDSIRTSQIASLVGSFVSLARALNNFNNMYFIKTLSSITTSQNETEVLAENNGDKKTADTSSCCDRLTCTVAKMYQSIIDLFRNPKSTVENIIRKFKMDKVIFFVAHFLGIAARAIAISAFASFTFDHSSSMSWGWYTSAIFICVWLYFFNTVNPEKDDITRWQLWKQRLRMYFIFVWIHFFTFFPPSDCHMLGASSGIAGKVKRRGIKNDSTKRDYRGMRFCLFFLIYYVVLLTENGLFVGFWWASLSSNSSSTINKFEDDSFNTTLADVSLVPSTSFPFERYVVLCLNICFSLFSPFLLVIYYSVRSRNDEKKNQQVIQNDNALVDMTDSPEADQQEEIIVKMKKEEPYSRSSIIRKCGSRSISHIEPDLLSAVPTFSWLHACVIIAQSFVYVFKMVIDIALVILFYFRAVKGEDPHYWYFGLLMGILIVPAFITSVMSFMKFKQDHGGPDKACKLPFCIRLLTIVFILLLLSNLGRCINRLYYGIKSRIFLKEDDKISAKISYEHMETETRQHALIGLVEVFCFAPVTILQTYFIVRQIEKNEFVSSSMLPFWSVSTITFFISSAGQLTLFKKMFLNKRESSILSPFIISFDTSIREILIGHCTFFFAHFLGIAARVGAISVYISFFINHLSVVTWKFNNEEESRIVTTNEDLSSFNLTDVNNRLISISKVHGLWLLCDLAFRGIFTILWLFFINKMGEGKTRAKRWRKHLKLFSALVFVNLFTFFPSSNTHIRSKDKNRNLRIRDYGGTRFYLFFFIYYLVVLLENIKCVGLWWMYLPANISMTPGVSYLMIPVIIFSVLSPILLF